MSKSVKIILLVVGILAFLGALCVGGFAFLGYYFVDHEGISKSLEEGREFGKTTDNLGCQTRIVGMIKPLRENEINGIVRVSYFFNGCLETSRETPNFCDGVPNAFADIANEHRGKDAECAKLGLRGSMTCRQVIDEKLDFCDTKR